MYDNLTPFERALAQFADRVSLIVGLEVGGKIAPTAAYAEIKSLYKQLKKLNKNEQETLERAE